MATTLSVTIIIVI